MDAVQLLTTQHNEVDELFDAFEATNDVGERERIAREATTELRLHTTIEEELFYPALQAKGGELADLVLEDLEEHHVVEVLLDELESMDATDERFPAKFTVLSELVRHHVEEEEDEQFPMVREQFDDAALTDLGEQMSRRYEALKQQVEDGALTKEELYQRAQQLDIEGRSQMTKRQLSDAVRNAS